MVDENGELTAVDAARLLVPIAEALDFASRTGVVHRDVKPSNVLFASSHPTLRAVRTGVIDKPVVPLLSDFGIARAWMLELTNWPAPSVRPPTCPRSSVPIATRSTVVLISTRWAPSSTAAL